MSCLDASQKTVLVVEDDLTVQRAVAEMVEREGYRPIMASGLKEAKRLLGLIARPCIILLDTFIPEGWEWLSDLGDEYPVATIPVRISSALVGGGGRMFKRPVRLDMLRDTIRRHCGT